MNISTYFEKLKKIDFEQKSNIDDLNLVTKNNVISTEEYNQILSGISNCIECISALTHLDNQQFSKFWEDIEGYVIDIIEKNHGNRVKTFNGLTGDVWGISGITLNNVTYIPQNRLINNLPTLKTNDFNSIMKNQLLSYNGLKGDVSGISKIIINDKEFQYNTENNGIPNIGNYQKSDLGYVTSFNNLTGGVSGLYGININETTFLGPSADFYSELSSYIFNNYINHWALKENQYFNGTMTLENTPSQNESASAIINIEYVKNYIKDMISKINRKTISLKEADNKLSNSNSSSSYNEFIFSKNKLQLTVPFQYRYIGTAYILNQNKNPVQILKIKNVIVNDDIIDITLEQNILKTENLSNYYLIYYVKYE